MVRFLERTAAGWGDRGARSFTTERGETPMMENRRLFIFAAVLFAIAIVGYVLGA
ncbi:MAG: hypothetical protein ACLGHC_04500 [Alphaproteobacteria bacterium]